MKSNPLEARLMAGFIAALSMLLFAGWQMYRSLDDYRDMSHLVNHSYEVLGALADVSVGMRAAEFDQRSFIITGQEIYVTEHDHDVARVKDALIRLKRLTADNSQQQLGVARLERAAMERLQFIEKTIALYRSQGFEAARERIRTGDSYRSMEAVLKQAEAMEGEERALLVRRNNDTERSAQRTLWSGGLMTMLALVGIYLLWWRVRREVRERRSAEAAVRGSEALLQQILDLLPVGVFVSDAAGQLTRINPAGKEIWGGERYVDANRYNEYKGWWPATGQPIAAEEWALARTLKSGEIIRNELVDIEGFDGSRKTILNNTMPIRDEHGQMMGGVAVNLDVTEFKRTERELRLAAHFDETQSQALALFSTSFDRRAIFDGLLALLARNHPFPVSALYGYNEWNGLFQREAAHGLAADVAREFAFGDGLLGVAAQTGETVVLDTAALTLQTGIADFAPTAVLMIPICYQEKRLALLVLAASQPLGDKERGFLELLASQLGVALHNLKQYGDLKLLAEQLRVRSEEIASKNLQLEEASRMKTAFLANMSHELRTPLNAIIGFAEVLKDGLLGEVTEQQKEYITDIFTSGSHLLSLINDILDLSKVEAGKMTLELEAQSVPSLVRASLQVIREMALAHRLHVTSDVPDDLGELWIDQRKVRQMLYNLLSNAVKFTPEGGKIHVTARQVGRSAVPGGAFEHYLELAVSDSGIGISPKDQARLFQPFIQIDSTLSRRYEGTGLGLVMVQRLAELHGGTVTLHSEVGSGSTFTVRLPWRTTGEMVTGESASTVPTAFPAAAISATKQAGRPSLALVIEDNDKAADLLRLQLEDAGFRVIRTVTAESALELVENEVPDIITLDILLPGMDGWDFLERIKHEPRLAAVPVVIISIAADRGRGISLGAAQVLQKPVSRVDLLNAIEAAGFHPEPNLSRSVLVVDDDPKAVQLVGTHLESAGYRVLPAFGGKDAIAVALGQHPDLIVLDLMMPEVNGFDVVEALKNEPTTAAIPVIIVTAKQITAEDRQRLNSDVLKILEKSDFNHGRFIGEVNRALTGKDR